MNFSNKILGSGVGTGVGSGEGGSVGEPFPDDVLKRNKQKIKVLCWKKKTWNKIKIYC